MQRTHLMAPDIDHLAVRLTRNDRLEHVVILDLGREAGLRGCAELPGLCTRLPQRTDDEDVLDARLAGCGGCNRLGTRDFPKSSTPPGVPRS